MSAQEVYIISFHATHGDNHWAFFIPHPSTPHRGVYINAAGNPFQGFSVVIEGNRDLELEFTRHWLTLLGHVSVSTEVLKEVAREIKAPGVSPRPQEPVGGQKIAGCIDVDANHGCVYRVRTVRRG